VSYFFPISCQNSIRFYYLKVRTERHLRGRAAPAVVPMPNPTSGRHRTPPAVLGGDS
jgi:hypothetical protein